MTTKQLANLLAIVVRRVATEDIYLDRALRDIFKDKKVVDPNVRRAVSIYAPFVFRQWNALGGSNGDSIISIVTKALEVSTDRISNGYLLSNEPDFPEWMVKLAEQEVPNWKDELISLGNAPRRFVRANRLKITVSDLLMELRGGSVLARPHGELADAIEIVGGKEIYGTRAFKEGWLEVQDISSQQVAPFLLSSFAGRGLVIDACAGNGGKTLHIGTIMGNRGRIISMDIYPQKLEELKRRALRAGISNVETRVVDTTKVIKRLHGKADFLLLDVPCSGTGVLRRNPEAKLRMKFEDIANVKQQQGEILDRYSKMVKAGGVMVYATCSILHSENRGQVDAFLSRNSEFTLEDDRAIMPSSGGDGFYMARLRMKG